tara:strand:+ start:2664 stop:4277 length:1614 start_codon:yes stop_codon:yes gene_type:complete
MRYKEFLLEYSREKTMANDSLMTKVMAAVKRKDPRDMLDQGMTPVDNNNTRQYILDKFERMDPTPNKQYIQPLMNWYTKDKFRGFEDQGRLRDALSTFARFKQRLEKRDINQYADINELEDAVAPHALELTKKEKRQQSEYHIDPNSYDVFAESARYVVVIPKTSQASCSFGAGTRWCTASTGSSEYFDEYSKDGPLYIIRTKDANYDKDSIIATSNPKFQLHFETGQFMDVQDRPITLNARTAAGLDKELYNIFEQNFKDALTSWMSKFMQGRLERTTGRHEYDWNSFRQEFPVLDVIRLIEGHNHGEGPKVVNKTMDQIGFTDWYKQYYEKYKNMSLFDFMHEVHKVVIPILQKKPSAPVYKNYENELEIYLGMNYSDRTVWWNNTLSEIRTTSKVGEYLRLQTYSKYDYEIGELATKQGIDIDEIDKHYSKQKFISKNLAAFKDIFFEFAETVNIAETLEDWHYEYMRIKHWVSGNGIQAWTDKYIVPKMLEEKGLEEKEIQELAVPLDIYVSKPQRDATLNLKEYKPTWEGLI